jgi:hypothetical protein
LKTTFQSYYLTTNREATLQYLLSAQTLVYYSGGTGELCRQIYRSDSYWLEVVWLEL